MTVATTASRKTFTWSGTQTSFACGFQARAAADISVTHISSAGLITKLALGKNFTVTIDAATLLVTVQRVSFPAARGTIVVSRNTPYLQQSKFVDGEAVPAATHELLHDRHALRDQELRRDIDEALSAQVDAAQVKSDRVAADLAAAAAIAAANQASAALSIIAVAQEAAVEAPSDATTLLANQPNGLAIDATTADYAKALQIKDTVTPANNYTGTLMGKLATTCFPQERLCMLEDESWRWSPHQRFLHSNDYTQAAWVKTGVTVTAGQTGADGVTTDATLLTATAATASLHQVVAGTLDMTYSQGVIAKGAGYLCIELTDTTTRRTWFNLATGVVGTSDAGNVYEISAVNDAGAALQGGFRHYRVHRPLAAASVTYKFYLCDANGALTATVGSTITIQKAQNHRGARRLAYLASTTAAVRDVPYCFANGKRGIKIDESAAPWRGLHSNDLTNAVWTKTGLPTVLLDQTGPDGVPCSSIALASNGEAIVSQAVVSAGTTQTFPPFLKIIAGNPQVFLSMDGGVTRVEITGLLNGATFRRGYAHGAVANPTIAIIVSGLAGDKVAVWQAGLIGAGAATSPFPVAGVALTTTADLFRISPSLFPTGSAMFVYADFTDADDTTSTTRSLSVGLQGAPNFGLAQALYMEPGVSKLQVTGNDGVPRTTILSSIAAGGRVQTMMRWQANNCTFAFNGQPALAERRLGAQSFTSGARAGANGGSMWLHQFVALPLAVPDSQIPVTYLNRNAPTSENEVLASDIVFRVGSNGAGYARVPGMAKLYETETKVGFVVGCMRRHEPGYGEAPCRQEVAFGYYEKKKKIFVIEPERKIIAEPAGWALDLGHSQGITMWKKKVGANKGRLMFLYSLLDGPGKYDDGVDGRKIYYVYSDDNGKTLSAPVNIITTEFGSPFALMGDNGSVDEFLDGPFAGRVVFSMYGGGSRLFWTDDAVNFDWSDSTPDAAAAPNSLTEPSIAVLDRDTVLMVHRNDKLGDPTRIYTLWKDGGATPFYQGPLPGPLPSLAVNCSILNADPAGQHGRYGRIFFSAPTKNYAGLTRANFAIYTATDAALTFGNPIYPFGKVRYNGYSKLIHAYDEEGHILLAAFENGPQMNVEDSVSIAAVRMPFYYS